jgi:hypothetical protein
MRPEGARRGPPSQEAGFGLLDGLYSMVISLGGGQGSEPDRWAYSHGYSGYLLDDPTLEINDQGLPFYTVTLLRPRVGWTFGAPVGVLVINAHTGQINRYALGGVPYWVDRVYSQQMAMMIANWYGEYSQAGFQGIGSSDANRFRVSGDPVMVYTGASRRSGAGRTLGRSELHTSLGN